MWCNEIIAALGCQKWTSEFVCYNIRFAGDQIFCPLFPLSSHGMLQYFCKEFSIFHSAIILKLMSPHFGLWAPSDYTVILLPSHNLSCCCVMHRISFTSGEFKSCCRWCSWRKQYQFNYESPSGFEVFSCILTLNVKHMSIKS
jgi:hypothetical protein